jgi:hypothetical protein
LGYRETINTMNRLFENSEKETNIHEKLNLTLLNFTIIELANIHGDLSKKALFGLYSMLGVVQMPTEAKEHVIYKYYLSLIPEHSNEIVEDYILEQILRDFKSTSYLALESLLVKLLKEDRISDSNLDEIKNTCKSKIIDKEVFSSEIRSKIKNKIKLTENDVQKLREFEKYYIIETALDNDLIERHNLLLFELPVPGDKNKKIKTIIFTKASKLLRG